MQQKHLWNLEIDIVLASSSAFKKRLLENAGFVPSVCENAEIDEDVLPGETPEVYVGRVALEKAKDVAKRYPHAFVLGADTVIVAKGQILRKSFSEQEARQKLELLSGIQHVAMTGYAIISPDGQICSKVVQTTVVLKELSPEEIEALLASGEWKNVAAYKIEGMLSAVVKEVHGSYPNIVGLPVFHIAEDLKEMVKRIK